MTDSETDARRYHRQQLALSVASTVLTAAVLVGWLWSEGAVRLATALAGRVPSRPAVVALVLAAVGGSASVVTFPIDILRGFVLPRRAGLLVQSLGGWLADRAKTAALGGGLALATFQILYALLA
ncbi:MAG: hypothetical protein ACRELA_10555, partial [Candidatus Rokuibacteriota bacterium]